MLNAMKRRHRSINARWRKFRRRTPPGASPGTIINDPSLPRPVMRVMAYGPGGCIEGECQSPDDAAALRGRHEVVWLNVDGLGDAATIMRIGELFGLHKLALEDVVHTHQRAKVEPYGDHLFVVCREVHVVDEPPHLETDQISMFLGPGFVVTFQEHAGDAFDPVRERIRKVKGRICYAGPDYLAYALLDAIIDSYFPVLERYGERLEALEDETIELAGKAGGRETVAKIHAIKRDFLTLRRAVWPLREAISTLVREQSPQITDDTRMFMRDCYDHTVQLIDMLETYRETGSDLMEVYLSSVSNRLNEVMKVLTIISTIFIPLSFIAGIYGMNFNTRHPMNMPELNWRLGYPWALMLMAGTAAVMLVFFWRRGWLGGRRGE